MPIILTDFGGEIPKVHPVTLPDNAAQKALNCTLRGGAIEPISVPSATRLNLNDGTYLNAVGVTTSEITPIAIPSPPTVASISKMCPYPPPWLNIDMKSWVSYIDVSTGNRIQTAMVSQDITAAGPGFIYDEDGIWIIGYMPGFTRAFNYGGPYFVTGPKFRFRFSADSGGVYGGPDISINHPVSGTPEDQTYPTQTIPLINTQGNVYAQFQVVDYYGPIHDKEILVTDMAQYSYTWNNCYIAFRVNMNYSINTRRHFYYVQSRLVADGADYREGPPSENSDLVTLRPGERVTIDVDPLCNLYRSNTGNDDFLLIEDEISGSTYTDWEDKVQGVEIPPFGNAPVGTSAFLRGAFWHPSHFVVALYDGVLYMSDTFRGWSFPDEYTLPFPGAIAHILSGNTTLVFDATTVWAVTGGNQEQVQRYALSPNYPLLSVKGLCRIGNTIFWPTNEGLASCNGSQIEIITRGHFSEEQWAAYTPATMTCETVDNSILITTAGSTNLRFDLDEKLKAVTTWTSTTATDFEYQTKTFWSKDPVCYDWGIISCDGAVTVKVYADGVLVHTENSATNGVPFEIDGSNYGRQWSFEVTGQNAVRGMEFYERVVTTVQDTVRLAPDTSPVWQSTRVRFQDTDRFCLAVLSAQGSATLSLTVDNVLVVNEASISQTAGPYALARDLTKGFNWKIDVDCTSAIDELILYRRKTQPVSGTVREIHDGPVAPWRIKRYELPLQQIPRSVIVQSEIPVTINLYANGATAATESVGCTSGVEAALGGNAYGTLEFDFGGNDKYVKEVTIFLAETQMVGEDGIQLLDPESTMGLLYRFPEPGGFAACLVGTSDYAATTITFTIDGVPQTPITVQDEVGPPARKGGQPFVIPRTYPRGLVWKVDLVSTGSVDALVLVPWKREEAEPSIRYTVGQTTIPPWMYTIYEFKTPIKLMSGKVRGPSYPINLRMYADGATSASKTEEVEDGNEFRFSAPLSCSTLTFDFSGEQYSDGDVYDVMLFGADIVPVEGGGVVIRPADGRPAWRNKILQFKDVGSFSVARVTTPDTGCVLSLIADGSALVTETIGSSEDIILDPGDGNFKEWELDLECSDDIREVVLIARTHYQFKGKALTIKHDSDPYSWKQKRIVSSVPVNFSSIRVSASDYPVDVTVSDITEEKYTITVNDEKPVRAPRVSPRRVWIVDFLVSDPEIQIYEAQVGTSMAGMR